MLYCIIGGIAAAFVLANYDISEDNFVSKLPEYVREPFIIISMPILILITAPILLLCVIAMIVVVLGLLLAIPFAVVLVLVHTLLNSRRPRK